MTARTKNRTRWWLTGLEILTGTTAAGGGALLIARPDGHLIGARSEALSGSPFSSWLVPGVLLLTLVGGGYLATAWCLAADARLAPILSVGAGVGLIGFESCEVIWLGFQPLEVVFMAVGLTVATLGVVLLAGRRHRPGPRTRQRSPDGPA